MACIPTSQVPAVAPSRSLELGDGMGARPEEPFAALFTGASGAVSADAQLNVVFNRPLRALGTADSEPTFPVTLTPAIEGRWRWVGTNALLFEPRAGRLPNATQITLKVPAGIEALDGSRLERPLEVTLETPRPRVVGSHPFDGQRSLRPNERFELRFNQGVDLMEVRRALRLRAIQGTTRRALEFHVSFPDPQSPRRVLVTPEAPLPAAHVIELELDASLRGTEGPLPAGETRTLRFETYGPLAVENVHCPEGPSGTRCAPGQGVELTFSNEVLLRDVKRALTIEPPVPITWASWQEDTEHLLYLYVQGEFAAGSTYTVRLAGTLKDIYGQKLGRTFTHQFVMDDHWPRLEIGVRGDVFEPGQHGLLPVASINVPEYTLLAAPLSPEQVTSFFTRETNRDAFELLARQSGVRPRVVRPSVGKNRIATESIDTRALLAQSGGRGALVVATRREVEDRREESTRLLQVTDLAVTAKLGRGPSVAWITSLSTGKPVAGAEVRIVRADGSSAPVLTDAHGLATLPAGVLGPDPEREADRTLLIARHGSDWTYRQVSHYLDPWRMSVSTDVLGQERSYGLLFTERGLYRPGDEVQVKGILRRETQTGNAVLAGHEVTLVLRAPSWEEAGRWQVTTNEFGTFSRSVVVPRTARLGEWHLEVRAKDEALEASTGFTVAEYRPTEIQAQVSSAEPSYLRGNRARFEVRGDYLYGAPMAGAEFSFHATRSETTWHVPGLESFVTDAWVYDSGYPDKAPEAGLLAHGGGTLDGSGRREESFSLELPGQRGPELVHFDAEVVDVSRQAAASSSSVVVHPAEVYVAIERPKSYFHDAPGKLKPRALVTSPSGAVQAGRDVRFELVRRRWTVARLTNGGEARTETRVVDDVVSTCSVRSANEPRGCELDVKEAGYYIVLATTRDARGRVARAALDTYGIGAGEAFWRDDDRGRLELVLDKDQYRPGETARVLVKSPFPEADALVTVEADGVFEKRTVRLSGPTPTLQIPIDERLRPNAYVSVHLVRPRSAPQPGAGKADLGAPTYRVGHAELRVDPETRRLRVALAPSKKELRPGEEIEVDVDVKDAAGKPARAEVTLYAVDEGVLSLIGYRTPDPLPVFTAPRPLRTATLESRQTLGRVLADLNGLLGIGPDKGDEGGGGGEGSSGSVRKDFRQSAYFDPTLLTSAQGKARAKFRLPESLTTYRLMAVVVTEDDRYGYAEERVVTNKRLMARPALPRSLRAGDQAEAGVVVSTKGLGAARARVTLEASGIDVVGERSREIELPPGQPIEVRFPLAARQVGQARFRFTVTSGAERDAVEVTREIHSPATLETVALYGETTSAAAEALGDLSATRKDVGGLEVKAASTALVGIDAGFQQLIEFPYGCTEQLSSKLLPLLPMRSLASAFGAKLPSNIDAVIEKSVAEILTRQRHDGGFGMWPESAASSPWVSAYATWTLHEAARRKVPVPRTAMEEAKQYLRAQLEGERDALWLASAPFWVDVLATLGHPDAGYTAQLFERRSELPVFSRALLLHALVAAGQPRSDVQTLARELESTLHIEADRAYATENLGDRYAVLMDSPARTTALVLRGLLAARPDHPLGPRLARGLLAARQGGTWRSTQETAFALLALDEYRRLQESVQPNFVARLWFGEEKVAEFPFRKPRLEAQGTLIPIGQVTPGRMVFEKDGQGTLFYEARLSYARTTLPSTSLERGFFVQKTLRPVKAAELPRALASIPSEGATSAPAGSLVLADLLLVAPSSREYVVLEDPLPAGLEAVDARLATTARWANISGSSSDDVYPSDDDIAHGRALLPSHYRQELRDDRVLFFVDHLPAGIYHYRYLARATTPGQFVVPPTRAEEMYNPEVFGRTGATRFEVK